jgi:glycosyltransferase involved in cell wall biosynthesis
MMTQPQLKLLYLGTVWPEPTSSAAGVRTHALIQDFKSFGYEIYFVSPSKEKNEFVDQLTSIGVKTESFQPNDSAFDEFVRKLSPDVVIYDRFILEEQFGWRVKESSAKTLQVLDLQDLHSLRRARMDAFKKGIDFNQMDLLTDDALREVASIYRCDLTLVISPFEKKLLEDVFHVPEQLLLELGYSYAEPQAIFLDYSKRSNFVMIGNFRHPPNYDAVFWLKEKIWPEIRKKIPNTEVHLYGAYPPKEVMALDDPKTGFRVKGPTPDSIAILGQYRVSLAPLRFGAGIKGKIADSWSAGTPVVTTPIGAEGMSSLGSEFAGEVRSNEVEFAEACAELYEDEVLWRGCQLKGKQELSELYGVEKNRMRLKNRLNEQLVSQEEFRRQNVVGLILSHASLRSTKYFSKWIELKESSNKT